MKSGKRPRDEGTEARSPIRLPAKTVAQRNLNKQKIRDDWWSLSDTSNLSDNRHNSTNVQGNGYLNNSNRLLESSRYSSFPDSSVDISKVLAESSVNSGVDSKHDEVFDDSVDYIEEHEFLSYDVTSSPFSAYDTDEEHEQNGCLETRGHDEMPESPIPDVTYSIVNVKQELNSEIDAVKSNNEKVFLKFQKELEESEIRKTEVLKSRVVSDENIEVLASAIVTGVLAKAVIEIISFDSGEKNVKDSMKIIDIENSVDGNFNTNAKNDSSKTNAEIRELQEFHEKKEKGNENEQNISENNENISPTNDRPRLYSWPYSEDDSESKNETDKPNGKVIEVITPSKAHKVEIIVDQNASSEKEKLSVDLISKTVKTASESSKDFEKFYFKQKASQHGIEIVSPLRNLKETATVSSESDNESERSHQNNENIMAQMKKGRLDSLGRNSRSQSESSDYLSLESDSQTDPAYIFKQKASKLGIKIQNPKETIELSTENSDAELESYTFKNQDLHLEDSSRRDTSTPEPNLFLNPESPEFKPGWRKGMENNIRTSTRNEMRADAPEFNPGSLNTSSSDLNDSTSKIEMRVDAPEFNPVNFSMKTASQKLESLKKADENHTKSAKIFHIPTPKAQIEKPSIGIQASPKLSDCSVNTRRVKTKDLGVETNSCDSREVCVNTDVPGNMETESHTLSIKEKHFLSKNTNTDVPKRRSIAVSVNMTGRYQEKKIESENKEFVAEMCKLENEKAVMAEQIKYLQSCKNDKEQAEQMKSLQVGNN